VSFVDRSYPDLVRDVLTTLTQGVAREVHHVAPYDPAAQPVTVPDIVLQRRPVRRVSVVEGSIAAPDPADPPLPYTFSLNDYTLVPDPADPTNLSTIRFIPFGKKPAPDTDVLVNYYPRTTDPTPLTDLNVGSAVRTIVEAVSKELGILYAQLNLAYDSGFVESATGSSLDRVVALLGLVRFRAGYPTGTVRFTRRAGSTGSITIPAGTPVTDGAKTRYLTAEAHDMLAGESSAQVAIRGATATTPVVDTGKLIAVERAIAGLDTVTNDAPTTRASADETDEQLRARARSALLASTKGTLAAIKYGLLQLPEVSGVDVIEPPDTPGEVLVHVRLAQPGSGDDLPPAVLDRIEELRAAGIRVTPKPAPSVALTANLALVLAAGTQAQAADVRAKTVQTLTSAVSSTDGGKTVRTKPLVAALLADKRIVDATLTLGEKNAPLPAAGADYVPAAGSFVRLDPSDVSFAPETYDGPAPPAGPAVAVEVHATVKLSLALGVAPDAVAAQLKTALQTAMNALVPGKPLTFADVLNILRDPGEPASAKYTIDPLGTQIVFQAGDQFTTLAQDGTYAVPPGRTFTVVDPVLVQ
jgi:uncharacterized phage protein gp47/JayE